MTSIASHAHKVGRSSAGTALAPSRCILLDAIRMSSRILARRLMSSNRQPGWDTVQIPAIHPAESHFDRRGRTVVSDIARRAVIPPSSLCVGCRLWRAPSIRRWRVVAQIACGMSIAPRWTISPSRESRCRHACRHTRSITCRPVARVHTLFAFHQSPQGRVGRTHLHRPDLTAIFCCSQAAPLIAQPISAMPEVIESSSDRPKTRSRHAA